MSLKQHLESFFCDILELKEKKAKFYEDWAKKCDDSVGRDILEVLKEAEIRDIERLKSAQEELSKTNQWSSACRYIPERVSIADAILQKVRQHHKKAGNIECGSVKLPLDTGRELEEKAIALFKKQLEIAQDEDEKNFIEAFIAEEKEHLRLLADLKFYYEDPQGWLMEKGRGGLDGA
ncbi:MAG: hypothetical protein WHS38_09000 [Thermodesulforhabdaceae bacterium]